MSLPQIHLFQFDILWRQKTQNFQKVRSFCEELRQEGRLQPRDLVVLPEMFGTGFDVGPDAMSEGDDQSLAETGDFLSQLALDFGIYVQGSGVSQASNNPKTYRGQALRQNLVKVYDDQGQELATYQKVHPFSFGGEHRRFESGEGAVCFEWQGFQVAPIICYDLRFPELFRQAVLQGAEIFTVVANWPKTRQAHWSVLLQARAIENQAYVIGVNRVGQDQFLQYQGESQAFDFYGRLQAELGIDEGICSLEVDREALLAWRDEFPALQDMKQ